MVNIKTPLGNEHVCKEKDVYFGKYDRKKKKWKVSEANPRGMWRERKKRERLIDNQPFYAQSTTVITHVTGKNHCYCLVKPHAHFLSSNQLMPYMSSVIKAFVKNTQRSITLKVNKA